MNRIYVACVLSLLLFVSCASKDFAEPTVENSGNYSTSRAFGGGLDRVWEATRSAMEERNMVISQAVKERGAIITDWATGKSDRLFSGYGDSKIPYTIRFKFLVQVSGDRGRTVVSIRSKEEYLTDIVTSGSNFNGSLYHWIPTTSSGVKEATLLDDVAERLQQQEQ